MINGKDDYTDIFQSVRQINIVDVIQHYGLTDIKQRGRRYTGVCPLHADKDPSFMVFPESGRFHCFGCQAHGDAVDLYSALYNVRPLDAARAIAQDFGLPFDKPLSPKEKRKARERMRQIAKERETVDVFGQKIDAAQRNVSLIIRSVNHVLTKGGSQAYNELAEWVNELPRLEFISDCLLNKDLEMQLVGLLYWEDYAPWAS